MRSLHSTTFKSLFISLAGGSLLACGTTGPHINEQLTFNLVSVDALFQDERVLGDDPSQSVLIEDRDILRLDDNLKSYLDEHIKPIKDSHKRIKALQNFVFKKIRAGEIYTELSSKTAMQAYQSGTANCLSFANLFITAARHVHLNVSYHYVNVPPTWFHENETLILNQHINVFSSLSKPVVHHIYTYNFEGYQNTLAGGTERKKYLIDLNRDFNAALHPGKIITDAQAFALFYSNLAAEALVKNDLAHAYLYTKKSIRNHTDTSSAWNTLGIIYKKLGEFTLAEKAYRYAYSINPDELSALSNLALLYRTQGRLVETAKIQIQLEHFIALNPYSHFMLARTAYREQNYGKALHHLNTAIELKRNDPRFYLARAKTYLKLNQTKKARLNLDRAYRYASDEEKPYYYNKFINLQAFLINTRVTSLVEEPQT